MISKLEAAKMDQTDLKHLETKSSPGMLKETWQVHSFKSVPCRAAASMVLAAVPYLDGFSVLKGHIIASLT